LALVLWNTGESSKKKSVTIREISDKKIIRATPNQAENLTEIAFAAKRHWDYPERWIQIWVPSLTISAEFIEKHDTYVAYVDTQPIGFYAISIENNKVIVEHLWVLPEFMGRGIGADLFRHMISKCKELGVSILEIESDPNAQGFYVHMGAKRVGESVSELDGQPRILPILQIKLTK
jgi:GNAT superfamily N-acetyltransferase